MMAKALRKKRSSDSSSSISRSTQSDEAVKFEAIFPDAEADADDGCSSRHHFGSNKGSNKVIEESPESKVGGVMAFKFAATVFMNRLKAKLRAREQKHGRKWEEHRRKWDDVVKMDVAANHPGPKRSHSSFNLIQEGKVKLDTCQSCKSSPMKTRPNRESFFRERPEREPGKGSGQEIVHRESCVDVKKLCRSESLDAVDSSKIFQPGSPTVRYSHSPPRPMQNNPPEDSQFTFSSAAASRAMLHSTRENLFRVASKKDLRGGICISKHRLMNLDFPAGFSNTVASHSSRLHPLPPDREEEPQGLAAALSPGLGSLPIFSHSILKRRPRGLASVIGEGEGPSKDPCGDMFQDYYKMGVPSSLENSSNLDSPVYDKVTPVYGSQTTDPSMPGNDSRWDGSQDSKEISSVQRRSTGVSSDITSFESNTDKYRSMTLQQLLEGKAGERGQRSKAFQEDLLGRLRRVASGKGSQTLLNNTPEKVVQGSERQSFTSSSSSAGMILPNPRTNPARNSRMRSQFESPRHSLLQRVSAGTENLLPGPGDVNASGTYSSSFRTLDASTYSGPVMEMGPSGGSQESNLSSQIWSPAPPPSNSSDVSYGKLVAEARRSQRLVEAAAALTSKMQEQGVQNNLQLDPGQEGVAPDPSTSGSNQSVGTRLAQQPGGASYQDCMTSITHLLNSMNSITQLLNNMPVQNGLPVSPLPADGYNDPNRALAHSVLAPEIQHQYENPPARRYASMQSQNRVDVLQQFDAGLGSGQDVNSQMSSQNNEIDNQHQFMPQAGTQFMVAIPGQSSIMSETINEHDPSNQLLGSDGIPNQFYGQGNTHNDGSQLLEQSSMPQQPDMMRQRGSMSSQAPSGRIFEPQYEILRQSTSAMPQQSDSMDPSGQIFDPQGQRTSTHQYQVLQSTSAMPQSFGSEFGMLPEQAPMIGHVSQHLSLAALPSGMQPEYQLRGSQVDYPAHPRQSILQQQADLMGPMGSMDLQPSSRESFVPPVQRHSVNPFDTSVDTMPLQPRFSQSQYPNSIMAGEHGTSLKQPPVMIDSSPNNMPNETEFQVYGDPQDAWQQSEMPPQAGMMDPDGHMESQPIEYQDMEGNSGWNVPQVQANDLDLDQNLQPFNPEVYNAMQEQIETDGFSPSDPADLMPGNMLDTVESSQMDADLSNFDQGVTFDQSDGQSLAAQVSDSGERKSQFTPSDNTAELLPVWQDEGKGMAANYQSPSKTQTLGTVPQQSRLIRLRTSLKYAPLKSVPIPRTQSQFQPQPQPQPQSQLFEQGTRNSLNSQPPMPRTTPIMVGQPGVDRRLSHNAQMPSNLAYRASVSLDAPIHQRNSGAHGQPSVQRESQVYMQSMNNQYAYPGIPSAAPSAAPVGSPVPDERRQWNPGVPANFSAQPLEAVNAQRKSLANTVDTMLQELEELESRNRQNAAAYGINSPPQQSWSHQHHPSQMPQHLK